MSLIDDICCPEESAAPNCHGPVADDETIVLAIKLADHVKRDPDGNLVLVATALASDDVKGIDQGSVKRGVSFEREECAGVDFLLLRMQRLCGTIDPLVARATARDIRKIVDAESTRELCVHAEPTDESDRHGASASHGAFRARKNRKEPPTGLTWSLLRSEIARQFRRFSHLQSGTEPKVASTGQSPS